MIAVVLALELLAAGIVAVQSVLRLNRMTRRTRLPIVMAWTVIGGAAASDFAGLLLGQSAPDFNVALLLIGTAALVTFDKRGKV